MGNAMDFLNKHTDTYDNSMDKIKEHISEKGTMKIEDCMRNSGIHIAKYKEDKNKRSEGGYLLSPFHDLRITVLGNTYRLRQTDKGVRSKQHGYFLDAIPIKIGKGLFFQITEKTLRAKMAKNEITVVQGEMK